MIAGKQKKDCYLPDQQTTVLCNRVGHETAGPLLQLCMGVPSENVVNGGGDVNQGLQTAAGTNQVEIVKYLLEAGADPNQGVMLAKITHNEEILRLLIEAGASVTE